MKTLLIGIFFLFIFISCNKGTKYDKIPKITFARQSHTTLKAGISDSTFSVFVYFEDGDGNIGFGTNNLFFTDSRTPTDTVPYTIPTIPTKFDPTNGLTGIIEVDMNGGFLLLRTDTSHTESDTLHYSIYMKDEAGNRSNYITTPDLILTK